MPFHEDCAREQVLDYWYNPETSQIGSGFFWQSGITWHTNNLNKATK